MACSLFLLFNHEITPMQRQDALDTLGIDRIIDLPKDYKRIWRNIPPHLQAIEDYLEPIQTWLKIKAVKNDMALIQGDFGACYLMVNYAFKLAWRKRVESLILTNDYLPFKKDAFVKIKDLTQITEETNGWKNKTYTKNWESIFPCWAWGIPIERI